MGTAWWFITVFILLWGIVVSSSPDLLDMSKCNRSLGMQSGAIPNKDIKASSFYDVSVGSHHGRLNNEILGGAWCPKDMVSKEKKEYLEINLQVLYAITALQTQGRYAGGQGLEFAQEYWIEYWRPEIGKWLIWKNRTRHELIPGNTNTYGVVENKFDPFILAQKIRVNPYSVYGRTICMRIEIIGCPWKYGLVAYSMHQGVTRGSEVDLSDRTYDGTLDGGRLIGGLGQLTDGQRGSDNYRADAFGFGKGYEWVGWRNDTIGVTGRYVEIVFEFSEVRNFTLMLLHTNNMYTKDVQVFRHAKVFFSIGGSQFNGEPVHFSYMPDIILEHARDVVVKLHNRVGKYIRLHLYFATRWIMVSEINFDSVPAIGNFTEEEYTVTAVSQGNTAVSLGDTFQRDEVNTTTGKTHRRSGVSTVTNDQTSRTTDKEVIYAGTIIQTIFIFALFAIVFVLFVAIIIAVTRGKKNTSPPPPYPETTPTTQIIRNSSRYGETDPTYHEPYQYTSTYRSRASDLADSNSGERVNPCLTVHNYARDGIRLSMLDADRVSPPSYESTLNRTSPHNDAPICAPPVPPPPEQYYASIELDLSMSPPPEVPPITAQTIKTLQNTTKVICNLVSSLSSTSGVGDSTPEDDEFDEAGIVSFPWKNLEVIETFEEGVFGPINLCTVIGLSPTDKCFAGDLVAVHSLRPGTTPSVRALFDQHIKTLIRLKDPNIGEVFGVYRDREPFNIVLEHLPFGDLYQLLQIRVAESANTTPLARQTLSYGCLIYMAMQISSGMKYLETQNFIHKDLATRNCMVGHSYLVKVCDLGFGKTLYQVDYCTLCDKELPLPIRWMSWEYALLGKCSTKSDVWSFAVTLWEILTFAREQPFEELTDNQVMQNYTHYENFTSKQRLLPNPINCPKEIYDLMCECWSRNQSARPNFREIHLFLQRKNLGYKPEMH